MKIWFIRLRDSRWPWRPKPVPAETLKELAGKYLLPEKAYIYRVKP